MTQQNQTITTDLHQEKRRVTNTQCLYCFLLFSSRFPTLAIPDGNMSKAAYLGMYLLHMLNNFARRAAALKACKKSSWVREGSSGQPSQRVEKEHGKSSWGIAFRACLFFRNLYHLCVVQEQRGGDQQDCSLSLHALLCTGYWEDVRADTSLLRGCRS